MITQFNGYRESIHNFFLIIRSIIRVIFSGRFILGNELYKFEKNLSDYISDGNMFAVGVNSCTDAIFLSLKLYGIGEGDEVIVQSNTAIPTVNAIVMVGATPVFIDVDETHQMDLDLIEGLISEKTSALILVHLFGYSTNVEKVSEICLKNGLIMIEDCAQSFGGKYNGKMLGTFGDISCYSFYPTKILGGYGDAGAILCRTEDDRNRLRMMRFHGISSRDYYAVENAVNTMNSRMDEIQASILNEKIKVVNKSINRRRKIGNYYNRWLQNEFIDKVHKGDSVFYNYPIRVEDRNELIEYLKHNGITVGVNYPFPIHRMVGYDGLCRYGRLDKTEDYSDKIVNLPVYPTLRMGEVKKIVKVLNKYRYGT